MTSFYQMIKSITLQCPLHLSKDNKTFFIMSKYSSTAPVKREGGAGSGWWWIPVVTTVGTELVAEFGGASIPEGCKGGRGGGGPAKTRNNLIPKVKRKKQPHTAQNIISWPLTALWIFRGRQQHKGRHRDRRTHCLASGCLIKAILSM